jgi:hypothetical protein
VSGDVQNHGRTFLISSANWGKGEGVKERKKKRKAIPPINFLFPSKGV